MCMNCQNVYCKKCIDDWSKKDKRCPNRCDNPNYKRSIEKSNTLSKLKFKCEMYNHEIVEDSKRKCFHNPGILKIFISMISWPELVKQKY